MPAKRPAKAKKDVKATPDELFGRRLKTAREAAGLTQQELGDAVGTNKRVIARYEAGQAAPSVHAAARMARAAGTSLDALAGLSGAADPELARMLARLADLNDLDRAAVKRTIALAVGEP